MRKYVKKLRGSFLHAVLLIFLSNSLYADETNQEQLNPEDLFALSLSDLLEVEVEVANKYSTHINTAPAAVTVYEARDIQQLGYYTLAELADITAGYASNQIFAEQGFETRGQSGSAFDNSRHLVLVNDIPVNHVRSNKAPVEHELPLYFAEKVEYLRGPASALYGVGAFYGVVSITPFNDNSQNQMLLRHQGHRNALSAMMNSYSSSDRGKGRIAASYYRIDPSATPVHGEGELANSDRLYWDDEISSFIYADYTLSQGEFRGLTLGSIYMSRESSLGEYWAGSYSNIGNTIKWSTWVPFIKYEKQLSHKLKIKGYLKSNYSRDAGELIPVSPSQDTDITINPALAFAGYDLRYQNYEGLFETYYTTENEWKIVGGFNIDTRKQLGGPASYEDFLITADNTSIQNTIGGQADNPLRDSDDLLTTSLYGQAEKNWDLLSGFHFVGGVRYDRSEYAVNTNTKISPRVALVQQITPRWTIKYLWGNSLRAPSVKEATINKLVLSKEGVAPELVPETYETHEFNINWQSKHWYASLSYFQNETKDVIFRDWAGLGSPYDNRIGTETSDGYEVEVKFKPSVTQIYWLNYTDGDSHDTNDIRIAGISDSRINLGAQLSQNHWQASLVYQYVNGYTQSHSSSTKSYGKLDANIEFALDSDLKLHATGRNLLNESYRLPSGSEAIIKGEMRNWSLGLELEI